MKKVITILLLLGILSTANAISPYLLVGTINENINAVEVQVEDALSAYGFNIIGKYNPSGNSQQLVVVYSSEELISLCNDAGGRSLLAAALKISLRKTTSGIEVSMLNPEYLFNAYLRGRLDNSGLEASFSAVASKAKKALMKVGTEMTPFGGDLSKKELRDYKYMMGMPKFSDPVILNEFNSFDQGINTISNNLSSGKGNTIKVYEIISKENETAVFGVGLLDQQKGESHFLPIIGEKNLAAMPYEIILKGNRATILHGRFRFASHWPELTMGTFTKIMSSPGDVEEFLKGLTE